MNKFTKLALLAAIVLPLQVAKPAVVINEIYGGGGNAGPPAAPFNQDFVELFNNGLAAMDISGWMVQYASATGATFANIATIPSGTFLAAGASYLISAGGGATGVALPNVSLVGNSTNLNAAAGRVQLLNNIGVVADLVGYGATASTFEGAGPAPAGSNTTSIQRLSGIDTNNNNVDFVALAPTPIPEPATYMLFGLGILACAQRFRRKKH